MPVPGYRVGSTTNNSHNALHNALAAVISSQARVEVLSAFMLDPTRPYYQRQLEAATGLPIRAIQREVERLSGIDLLYRRVEGNRTYYQVDTSFPLFPELRSMVLKAAAPLDRLRGELAVDPAVRLAFVADDRVRVLVVAAESQDVRPPELAFSFDVMTSTQFADAVASRSVALTPYLEQGLDVLGRRDDVIWRRIEAAGYKVTKLQGVP